MRVLSVDCAPRSHRHHDNLDRAATWIAGRMRAPGVLRIEEQSYRLMSGVYRNVLGWRKGQDSAAPLVVIGAHYDAWADSPGADDNASGVAVLLELARTLRKGPPPTDQVLAAFSTEETSFLGAVSKGSHAFARRLREEGRRVGLMVSLEMLGYFSDAPGTQRYPLPGMRHVYGDRGDFIAAIGDLGSMRTVNRVRRLLRRAGTVRVRAFCGPARMPGILFSDHASFRLLGFPAAMVTDTAYLRNPHYHTRGDTADTLDYPKMAAVAEALRGLLDAA